MVTPINWNEPEDDLDLLVWDRLTTQFWLPEKIPVSNDLPTWQTLTTAEKEVVKQVFAKLTYLDTVQAELGAPAVGDYAHTPHEAAVMTNIAFMESVHAKSYSTIFATLCSRTEAREVLRWVEENPHVQKALMLIIASYKSPVNTGVPAAELFTRAASVLLESFLFYSGFFVSFHFASRAKLTNTADIIRLIVRDEGVHGTYIGKKFRDRHQQLTPTHQDKITEAIHSLAMNLYDIECQWTEQVYDPIGQTESVKTYLRYNLNKAMQNLGLPILFPIIETQVEPRILAQMATDAETHDFFSSNGSSYLMAKTEVMTDDDWV